MNCTFLINIDIIRLINNYLNSIDSINFLEAIEESHRIDGNIHLEIYKMLMMSVKNVTKNHIGNIDCNNCSYTGICVKCLMCGELKCWSCYTKEFKQLSNIIQWKLSGDRLAGTCIKCINSYSRDKNLLCYFCKHGFSYWNYNNSLHYHECKICKNIKICDYHNIINNCPNDGTHTFSKKKCAMPIYKR